MNPQPIMQQPAAEAGVPSASEQRDRTARTFGADRAGSGSVEQAIANAARRTTVDFDFLVAQAEVESAMNPAARARTSSATGLYQFIESTWLRTMQRHGSRFGMGDIASRIGRSASGDMDVADPIQRDAILAMRSDPHVASLMAAALAEDNRSQLEPVLGRAPDRDELYLAHFLGAGGAKRFLGAMATDPSQSAPALFAGPAAANRSVFFGADGSPRSLAGVMEHIGTRLDRARSTRIAWSGDHGTGSPGGIANPDAALRLAAIAPGSDRSYRVASAPPAFASRISAPERTSPDRATPVRPMSSLLSSTFAGAEGLAGSRASHQVRRAYDQLRSFGL